MANNTLNAMFVVNNILGSDRINLAELWESFVWGKQTKKSLPNIIV